MLGRTGPSFVHSRAHQRATFYDLHLRIWISSCPLSCHCRTVHLENTGSLSEHLHRCFLPQVPTAMNGRWARNPRPKRISRCRADSSVWSLTHPLLLSSLLHYRPLAVQGSFPPANKYLTGKNLEFLFLFRYMFYHTWIFVCFLK